MGSYTAHLTYIIMLNRVFIISTLLILLANTACNKKSSENVVSLKLIATYSLDVPEPSGLSFSAGNAALYTISDESGKFYKITLQGKLLSSTDCNGSDLEGISYDAANNSLWIIEERLREIINVDLQGNVLKKKFLDIPAYSSNNGLEGITVNTANGHIFCLNEKNPSLLIELDENQQIINEYNLNFANDYSGIFYDQYLDALWIISDESSSVTKCDLTGKVMETYHLSINQAEGIVVDSKNHKLYAVSDSAEKLYIFELNN